MIANSSYQNEIGRQCHRRNMENMARQLRRPVEEIELFYEDMLAVRMVQARVHDYLPALVEKNVKRVLGAAARLG